MLFSYCTNVHPGESWQETFNALRRHVPALRRSLHRAATDPFPLGLRLSAQAAGELAADKALIRRLRGWMEEENLLAYTINGFPYGAFHGTRIKEQVFAPDWSTPARVEYTNLLFTILSELLPEGCSGSVSTVPGSFKEFVAADPARRTVILTTLRDYAEHLDELSARTNLDFHLGLEPEPLGLLENCDDTVAFFDQLTNGLDTAAIARVLRRIGLCYDACHFAIAYEDPQASLATIATAGIRLSKIHLSNAVTLDPRDPAALAHISRFAEPTYLHQVNARHADGTIHGFRDLPDALAAPVGDAVEWRVHFHIPLFATPAAPLASTAWYLSGMADWLHHHPDACQHFEMETYTFDVLPEPLRQPALDAMLANEYHWCEQEFFARILREPQGNSPQTE